MGREKTALEKFSPSLNLTLFQELLKKKHLNIDTLLPYML